MSVGRSNNWLGPTQALWRTHSRVVPVSGKNAECLCQLYPVGWKFSAHQLWQPKEMRAAQPQTEMRAPEGKPTRIKLVAAKARGQNTVRPSHHSDPSMPPTSSVILQGVGRSPFLEAKTSQGGLVERVTAGWPSGCSWWLVPSTALWYSPCGRPAFVWWGVRDCHLWGAWVPSYRVLLTPQWLWLPHHS